ncbi:MAG: zinc ribbon domain-containing protein, partial [Anaerolineae bacterium]|nr:zinc ribbon domain-containing protein [Anaerolineae bacterium]
MIYCSECDTANQEGSRFCSKCGAVLPSPGVGARCPMCGEMNPAGTVHCAKCGARLTPAFAEDAGSQFDQRMEDVFPSPAEPAPDLSADSDWLRGLRDDVGGESPPASPEAPEERVGLPDWLSGAGAEEAGGLESVDLPDWLGGLEPAPAPAEEAPPAAADLPDW